MDVPEGFSEFLSAMESLAEVQAGIEDERQGIVSRIKQAKGNSQLTKLYHYTSPQGLFGILRTSCIWATDYRSLNDSTELQYGTKLVVEELESRAAKVVEADAWFLQQLSNLLKADHNPYLGFFETYILSFSEVSDVLSQWRAYADQARGHCLEFDLSDSSLFAVVDNNVPLGLELLPVIYEPAVQRAIINSAIDHILNYLHGTRWSPQVLQKSTQHQWGAAVGMLIHALSPIISSFKHPGFSEEREWRALASCAPTMTAMTKKTRPAASGEAVYLECIFIQGDEERLWQRSHLPISEIKHGPLAGRDAKLSADVIHQELGYEGNLIFTSSAIPLKA